MSSSLWCLHPDVETGRVASTSGWKQFQEAEMKYLIMVLSNPESAAALRRLSEEQGREFAQQTVSDQHLVRALGRDPDPRLVRHGSG